MVFGGWGSMAAMLAGGGMVWLVNQINPYANKTAIVLAGMAIFVVGWVFNKTEIVSGPQLDPTTGDIVKERHHVFWINVEWWGAAVAVLGFFV